MAPRKYSQVAQLNQLQISGLTCVIQHVPLQINHCCLMSTQGVQSLLEGNKAEFYRNSLYDSTLNHIGTNNLEISRKYDSRGSCHEIKWKLIID